MVKSAMYKVIGRATLTWDKLCDMVFDIEIQINQCPLSYMEDDVELHTCWRRWKHEYLTALRERHSLIHNTPKYEVKAGEVVIIKTDDKNRGKWPLAIVESLFPGPDDVTRAVQLRTKNGLLERPVQHLYPLEMQCDTKE